MVYPVLLTTIYDFFSEEVEENEEEQEQRHKVSDDPLPLDATRLK